MVILAAAAITGQRLDHEIRREKESRILKIAETARLGIAAPAKPLAEPGGRGEGESAGAEETKKLAAEVLAFAQEMAAAKRGGQEAVAALRLKMVSVMGRVMTLNPAQLRIMIAETLASPGLDEALRQEMLAGFLTQMGKADPAGALSVWKASPEKFTNEVRTRKFISATLTEWGRHHPQPAMDWARTNGGAFPEGINEDIKRSIAVSTAASNPALAFRFVNDLQPGNRSQAAAEILGSVSSSPDPQAPTGMLKAFRAYLAENPDPHEVDQAIAAAMPKLAAGVAKAGFASSTAWIAEAGLEEKELAGFLSGVPPGREEGQWIDWISRSLPASRSEPLIAKRIAQWTEADHQAVGEWLNRTPDSAARQAAISAFAATVARYEPEAAERWAQVLPAGPEQQRTFQQIQANWPAGNPAGAEAAKAFARRHGLQE